jgi:hypothetical protein
MIIKFQKMKDTPSGEYDFKTIVGTKADGSLYERRVIVGKGTADLINALSEFGEGDFVELKYDDSKWKNVKSATPAKGFPEGGGKSYTKKAASSGAANDYRRTDGTSRGDDTNRSAAIYLAEKVVFQTMTAADVKKKDVDLTLAKMFEVANKIHKYITTGEGVADTPKTAGGDDVLDPPEV